MIIDFIILSKTIKELASYLHNTVKTLTESDHCGDEFNLILVESCKTPEYEPDTLSYITKKVNFKKTKFNYNDAVKQGLKHCKGDWVCICNNDLLFHKDWYSKIKQAQKVYPETVSFSPCSPSPDIQMQFKDLITVIHGYRTHIEVSGWCILFKRDILNKDEFFDSVFEYYYQDDDYAMTLFKNNMHHALVTNSIVEHLLSKSENLLSENANTLLQKHREIFVKKWKDYLNHPDIMFRPTKLLSIIILTLPSRKPYLTRLCTKLNTQFKQLNSPHDVELIVVDGDNNTIGEKRNTGLHKAQGVYSVFIDDDDDIADNYLSSIIKAIKLKPDVITIRNNLVQENGKVDALTIFSLKQNVNSAVKDGKNTIYYRKPQHLTPIKTSIARTVRYPNVSYGEDMCYGELITPLLKTEVHIPTPIYKYIQHKNKR